MTLDKTPIMILEKEIKFLQDFIRILQTKDGIDPNAKQEDLDKIVVQCEEKIKEFEAAITKLKSCTRKEPMSIVQLTRELLKRIRNY